MSVEAISWALNDAPDVPAQCVAVLVGLANHAHANGRGAYPSQERLAHYARKSVRSVRNDLTALNRLGLIRRGDQRYTAFLPPDRRPIVWDLALERRREVPGALDVNAEPQSGRGAFVPGSDRAEAGFPPVPGGSEVPPGEPTGRKPVAGRYGNRAEAQYRTAGSVLPSDRKPASDEPSKNHKEPRSRSRSLRGAALPTNPRERQCSRHRGQPASNCAACRSETLGGRA